MVEGQALDEQPVQNQEAIEFRQPWDWEVLAVAILLVVRLAAWGFDFDDLLLNSVFLAVIAPLVWIGYRFRKIPLVVVGPEAIEAWNRWCRRTRIAFSEVSAIAWESGTLALDVGDPSITSARREVVILAGLGAEDRATIGRLIRERMAGPAPDEAQLAQANQRQRARERLWVGAALLPPLAIAMVAFWLVFFG